MSTTTLSSPLEPVPPAPVDERPPWRPWTAPGALFLGLFAAFVMGSLVYVVNAVVSGHSKGTPTADIVATVLQDIGFIGAAVFFAQLAARPTPEQFGLRPTRIKLALKWMAIGYAIFWGASTIWLALLDVSAKDHSLDDLGKSTAAVAAAAVLVSVIAPIAEEFLFRGYIFTALRGWAGVWGSATITGLLFGAIHVGSNRPWAFLPALAVFGFVLCLIYYKTRSLYPCIALHALNNAVAFGGTQNWTWQIPLLAVGALAVIALILLQVRRLGTRWAAVVAA